MEVIDEERVVGGREEGDYGEGGRDDQRLG